MLRYRTLHVANDRLRRNCIPFIPALLFAVAMLFGSPGSGPMALCAHAQSAAPDDLQWWRDAKFGLFIHWGPASLTGKEISWSRAGKRPGLEGLPPGDVPVDEYDTLYQRFNPVEFDASEWVRIARDAGMRYLVFTTKHHDGFCLFDSKLTDYTIMASPYHRDITAELARACHDAGFRLGFYYSLPDWHHPGFHSDHPEAYTQYLHGQIRELCSNYGRVDVLWFDGKNQGTAETWDSARLIPMIRQLQPHILINDRVWGDTDFDTPEQVIGRFEIERPWESCITVGNQWSYKPNDRLKSWQECVQLLARCVGGGGNMLLNVGPMPSGAIEPRQVDLLRDIGRWLKANGEAIYATQAGPYAPSFWGASTRRGTTVYLHIMPGWEDGLTLAPLERAVSSAHILGGGPVDFTQTSGDLQLDLPPSVRRPPVTIVVLQLDGPADTIKPIPSGMGMPAGATAEGSNIRRNEPNYAPGKAVDDSPMSRWATDDGVTSAWLNIHLPEPVTFDVIMCDEAFGPRVQAFQFLAKVGDAWKPFYQGTTMGRNWAGKFAPVTARDLRLEIQQASDGPTIRDVQLHILSDKP